MYDAVVGVIVDVLRIAFHFSYSIVGVAASALVPVAAPAGPVESENSSHEGIYSHNYIY